MRRMLGSKAGVLLGTLWVVVVASCANGNPQDRVRREAHPEGSVYIGWRVFQDRCARCHGPDATGSGIAPNLLPRVAEMGEQRFTRLVLLRYDWTVSQATAGREGAARDALVDDVLARREPAMTMPAWQGEPQVNAHIADLYAYLSARADGRQGLGRPAR